jgi:hypothetical protein
MYCESACDVVVLKESDNAPAKSQIGVLAITRILFLRAFAPKGGEAMLRRQLMDQPPLRSQWASRNLGGDWQNLFPRFARPVSITPQT